jgi:hypothetical protein
MIELQVSSSGINVTENGRTMLSFRFDKPSAIRFELQQQESPESNNGVDYSISSKSLKKRRRRRVNKNVPMLTRDRFEKAYDEVQAKGGSFKMLKHRFQQYTDAGLRCHVKSYRDRGEKGG